MARVQEFRHYFHAHPELSTEEWATQRFICEQLEAHSIPYITEQSGVLAWLGEGERAIAFRADMDGLPIHEGACLPFCSEHEGVMHGCGHDMHMAMLLEQLLRLNARKEELQGRVYFIFQPSEEKRPGGARMFLSLLADNIEAVFGQHIAPEYEVGTVALRSGAFFASSDNIDFCIEGKGTHAATPQKGSNPILAACGCVNFFQTIVTKGRDPLVPAVLSITAINGGSANNVIPDSVHVKGTVRCHDNELRDSIFKKIASGATAIASLYDCKYRSMMSDNGLPVLMNDKQLTDYVASVGEKVEGLKVIESPQVMLGEDFAIYGKRFKLCFWRLGVAQDGEVLPPLHNSGMVPSDEGLEYGVRLLVEVALHFWN